MNTLKTYTSGLLFIACIVCLVGFFASCKNAKPTTETNTSNSTVTNTNQMEEKSAQNEPSAFTRCWKDSREEYNYQSGKKIYRPCDYKDFPPSRFRFQMVLNQDSTCQWLYLAPNDAHRMKDGTWKYNEDNKKLTIYDLEGEVQKSFTVDSIGTDIMVIKN